MPHRRNGLHRNATSKKWVTYKTNWEPQISIGNHKYTMGWQADRPDFPNKRGVPCPIARPAGAGPLFVGRMLAADWPTHNIFVVFH